MTTLTEIANSSDNTNIHISNLIYVHLTSEGLEYLKSKFEAATKLLFNELEWDFSSVFNIDENNDWKTTLYQLMYEFKDYPAFYEAAGPFYGISKCAESKN